MMDCTREQANTDRLSELRCALHEIDKNLLTLFSERQYLVQEVALFKAQRGLELVHPDVEQRKIDDLVHQSDDEMIKRWGEEFLRVVMQLSKSEQSRVIHDMIDYRNEDCTE